MPEEVSLLREALVQAPFLLIALGGLYLTVKMLLNHFERAEDTRDRLAAARHETYIAQLQAIQESAEACIDRNTEAWIAATRK